MTPLRAIILAAVPLGVLALVLVLSGGDGKGAHRVSGPFAWLRPAPAPLDWNLATTPSGARLSYPPSWRVIETDPGVMCTRSGCCFHSPWGRVT